LGWAGTTFKGVHLKDQKRKGNKYLPNNMSGKTHVRLGRSMGGEASRKYHHRKKTHKSREKYQRSPRIRRQPQKQKNLPKVLKVGNGGEETKRRKFFF